MNHSSEQFEKVLDLIYDAAAENALWSDAITSIADLTNSQGGSVLGQSFTARHVYFGFNGRMDEDCFRVYQEGHIQNPWSEYMEHQPAGRLVLSDEVLELSKLQKTGFYHHVLRPQNIAHNGMISLAAKRDFRAACVMCRGPRQGQYAPEEQRLLERLSPHLRRSIALGFRIDGYLAVRKAAFSVLEHLADAVIVLDRRAQVVFANAAARRLEAEGALRLGQPITTASPRHTQRLGQLLRAALLGAPGGTMALPRNADGHPLTIMVSSIRSKDIGRLSDAGYKDAAALLFVIDPANRRSLPLSQIMDAYGLTQAEARVALADSSGNTVVETAQLLKLSPNTIKTHLRRVFAKTATGRQAELAGLIASVGGVRVLVPERE